MQKQISPIHQLLGPACGSTTLCLKKSSHFKLSVTLSNLNRFSNVMHCWKCMKFATKPIQHYPPHLRDVAALPWEIKNSNFLHIFSRFGRKCKQIAFYVHHFNSSTHVTVYAKCIYVFFIKILSSSLNTMLIVDTVQWRLMRRLSSATNWSQK